MHSKYLNEPHLETDAELRQIADSNNRQERKWNYFHRFKNKQAVIS